MCISQYTIFYSVHIGIGKYIEILCCSSTGLSLTTTMKFTEISTITVSNWYKFFRRILIVEYASRSIEMIEEREFPIEINETHIYRRKFGVCRVFLYESNCVFEGIYQETKRFF
ncbi:hypothetical protein H311_02659 [Anncaliia algerae PRA109]|nr:hypothetical protein H311_02659 [Anncaliia algerae PRA109]